MSPYDQLLFACFFASAVLLGFAFWYSHLKWRIFWSLLMLFWLWQAQWYGRAYTNIRWVDDRVTRYQHDAILNAIDDARARLPLQKTTNFSWSIVCRLSSYDRFDKTSDLQAYNLLKGVLGDEIHRTLRSIRSNQDGYTWVYVQPAGVVVIPETWQRFTRQFQSLPRGVFYRERLKGRSYHVRPKFIEKEDNKLGGLCFRPDEVFLEISPE